MSAASHSNRSETHRSVRQEDIGDFAATPAFVLEPLLDSEQAAAVMKIHPKTLQKLARRGVVHGIHVGKLWRFRASAIQDWIERQETA